MIAVRLEADNKEAIKLKIKFYMANYPPQGYSTHFRRPEEKDDGTWHVVGYRAESSD